MSLIKYFSLGKRKISFENTKQNHLPALSSSNLDNLKPRDADIEVMPEQLQDLLVLIISILYYLRLISQAIKVREVYEVLGSVIRPN